MNILHDRRGIALPLSLLGLVIVSLLVAAALVTSGSEVAMSSAHQRSTSGLYTVEAGVEGYVAQQATLGQMAPGTTTFAAPGNVNMTINVARLFSRDSSSTDSVFRFQTYSVLGWPATGQGRRVGALVSTNQRAKLFVMNVTSGLTVGGNVKVSGNSTISDGRNTGCAAAPNALQVTAGSTITRDGSAIIEGKADTASFDKSQLVSQYLDGLSLQDAVKLATVKFAAGEFTGKPNSAPSGVPLEPKPSNKYNWGCPSSDGCASLAGNEKNRTYFPTVAIDAGGGTIKLQGDHGQGILLIHNGSLSIEGNFNYQGIILVEKDLNVKGTGGTSGGVKIDGAVMSLGQNSTVEDNASGNAVVTYNSCMINTALQSANTDRITGSPHLFSGRTHSWFEVVQ